MSENRIEIRPYEYMNHFMDDTALLVTMDNNGKPNVMALLWKTIGQLWMIPIITVAVAPSRYSFELLTQGVREFTVNIPSEKNAVALNIAGQYSGRNIDKFNGSNSRWCDRNHWSTCSIIAFVSSCQHVSHTRRETLWTMGRSYESWDLSVRVCCYCTGSTNAAAVVWHCCLVGCFR